MTMLIQWTVTSSVLILAVVLVRALLGKRMSAGLRYALWAVVLLRLLIPVQLFSVPVPQFAQEAPEPPQTQTAAPGPVIFPAGDEDPGTVVLTPPTQAPGPVQEDLPPAIHDTPDTPNIPVTPAPEAPAPEPFDWQGALGWLWLGGGIAMGLALVACNARFTLDLRRRRRPIQTDCKLPVYAVERLESPCLVGVVRPAVYVTPETAANPAMLRHVLAHETTHARHGDQVWSLLRCAALAVHWWNPLVWLAAFLSRRDGELACDEGAIKLLGDGERKAYGWTLLTLITAQPSPVSLMNAATTMSGGKKALWERVQRIAHAPKKAVWAAVLAIVLALAVTACAFSSAAAPKEEPGEDPDPTVSASPEPAAPENAAARQALYRALAEAEDIQFSSGNQHYDYGVNSANVTNLWPALGMDQGGGVLTPKEFTVLDLDGDGVDEAVLRTGDTDGWVFVLRYENGGVRGYYYYIRWFNAWALKADGTAPNSSSAAESGVGRLSFAGVGTALIEDVLYQLPVDGDWSNMRYTVNGEEVSEAEYNAALEQWDAQPEAPWYAFTQENIDALLGGTQSEPPERGETGEVLAGVMGFDQVRVVEEYNMPPGFFSKHYVTESGGRDVCVGESFGYTDNDSVGVWVRDLDGDGVTELICVNQFNIGGRLAAYVYRNRGGVIETGGIDESYYHDQLGWKLEEDGRAYRPEERYDPDRGVFVITDGGLSGVDERATAELSGLDQFCFRPFDDCLAYPKDAVTAQINGRTVTLTMDYQGGNPDGEVGDAAFTLICDGRRAQFTDDWVEETSITLAGADLDGDGAEEVVLAYTTSHLTGCLIQSLRVFDGGTLEQRAAFTRDDLPGVLFEQINLTGKGDSYHLTAPGVEEVIAKSEWDENYPTETDLMNTMVFGYYYEFSVADGRLYCDLGIWQGQCGSVRVELCLEYGWLACRSFRYVPAGADAQQTDLNRNGVPETLEVVEIDGGKQLRVMENGYCVWSEDGFYAHAGWNTLFLWRFEGHDWLLRYNPNMTTGSANHSYSLFCLTDGWQQVRDGEVTGAEMVGSSGAMEFDTNYTQAWHQPMDVDDVADFLGSLSCMLGDAQLLMNTNPELEDLHEQTGRWLTYPWDQFSTGGFAYNRNKTLEDNLRAWEEAGEFPDRQSAVARAAYEDILNGRRTFIYSTDWGMDTMGVAGIHALFDPYDPSMRIRKYALLDRDQDGVDEMVLYVCGASDAKGGCVVLDLEGGVNVDGYKVDQREVGDVVWQEMPYSAPAGSGGLPFAGPFLFQFYSGAGGWGTDLTLNADGTFTGEYSDSDMGDTGPGYHGTEYICTFHGRFGDIKQVSEHVWSLTLAELVLDTGHPIGEEWTEGGTRYISNAPYGLSAAGADAPPEPGAKFMLYTPGATQRETGADEDFYWWIHMGPQMDFRCWALHNLDTNYGFLAQ